MRKKLDELEQDHHAVAEFLECGLLSPSTRGQLEWFRDELEREIAFAHIPDTVSIVTGNDRAENKHASCGA
jgi:hypothetical protein